MSAVFANVFVLILGEICIEPLPNNKPYDLSKFKEFADLQKWYEIMKFVFYRVENMRKGKGVAYQHFLIFPLFSGGLFLSGIRIWNRICYASYSIGLCFYTPKNEI